MTSQQHGNANPALLSPQNSSSSQGRQHISRSPIDSYSRSGLSSPRRGWVAASLSATAHGNSLALSLSRLGPASCSNSSSSRRPASGRVEPWPEEAVDDAYGLYSLHRMFDIVGAQLTHRDVRVLSFLFVDVIDEYERGGIRSGRDFLLALERQGRCDETNFRHVLQLLRIITRHDLLPYVTLRKRQTVCPDPVDKYLEETSVRYVSPRGAGEAQQGTPHRRAGVSCISCDLDLLMVL
ncbi:death effector domain-containing protein-like [Sinocyclocheilus rhinocerous]|uniref:death effector domain-containing protein-like n=1 Tax=Sinocyclocheilus rhinocerous TaxID=307959 RepID=UPI0007BA3D20|nr:PREDICTED: death effector domain-containing protein-like [Sinocyclocheilus rhinocerous]